MGWYHLGTVVYDSMPLLHHRMTDRDNSKWTIYTYICLQYMCEVVLLENDSSGEYNDWKKRNIIKDELVENSEKWMENVIIMYFKSHWVRNKFDNHIVYMNDNNCTKKNDINTLFTWYKTIYTIILEGNGGDINLALWCMIVCLYYIIEWQIEIIPNELYVDTYV